MYSLDRYRGETVVVATMHAKEQVVGPVLLDELGLNTVVCPSLDTDSLGTFSGEVERLLSPLEAVRKKCHMALEITGYNCAIANEGSFGPHPSSPFLTADEEIILFVDRQYDIEVVVKEISTNTNFYGSQINDIKEVESFIQNVGFPEHAVIVKNTKDNFTEVVKGIVNKATLLDTVDKFFAKYGSLYLETDMRAHLNPMRRSVIKSATQKLVAAIKSVCPECACPGFSVIKALPGLPCDICGLPTQSTMSYLYGCKKCDHRKVVDYPHGKQTEDAMYCDYCNP